MIITHNENWSTHKYDFTKNFYKQIDQSLIKAIALNKTGIISSL